uniref:Chitin-binding type-2 domain-containing protein n=1 Tax=Cacopsylla melanoneura TaxID=428564 RepID=A0A8D9F6J1_9HEMI
MKFPARTLSLFSSNTKMSALLVFLILGTASLSVSAQRRPPNYSQDSMPLTSFTCQDKIIGGYYADPEADCQMFHVCAKVPEGVQDFRFLCPNNTSFDQENQICDDWFNIDCESHLQYNDNFDLYRVGFESSKAAPAKPAKGTPIPLGPTSARPIPTFTRQKPFQGGNSIDEDDNFLRSDTGDRRLHNDLLRGSSSSNFFSNKGGRNDYEDDPPIITKEQEVSKISNDFERKKNKAVVRKLLTGKRPIGQAANSVNNEQPIEYTTTTAKYQNLYRNKQTNVPNYQYTTTTTAAPQTQTTVAPTEATTQYVRPKNSNLRFRGSVNFNGQQRSFNSETSAPVAATQPTVDYYKKTSTKPTYNKNNYYTQTQQTTAQQQNYNTNQQQVYNANQQVNNNNDQAQIAAYNNGNQQIYNANNQAITANQQFYQANQQYNANQQNLVNGINQQAYNVNNLQTSNNQNTDATQQQNNNQQYNNGPTQVPLDYFKKTSVKQSAYKQQTATSAQNTQTQTNAQFTPRQTTQFTPRQTTVNANDYYRTSTTAPSTAFNYNEYYRTSTNTPSTTFNYQEFYRTSTNTPTTNNLNEFYRTSTSTPNVNEYYRTSTSTPNNNYLEFYKTSTINNNNNFNDYYKTSTTSPSTTFDYNEYYRTSAAAQPSSTANYYDPYNSYKEQFLANNAYEEDVQDEFLKTAPSNNLRPSEINAFSRQYSKPVAFNASLTAKLSYNAKAETTLKPTKEKTATPTQQTYFQPRQNTQTSVTHSVSQQKPTTTQQKSETPAAPQVQQTAAPQVQQQSTKTPTLTLEEYKKILEKPSDYDYAYYGGGGEAVDDYDAERIPEEFSKTKNIKKA